MENVRRHWRAEDGELINDGSGLYLTTYPGEGHGTWDSFCELNAHQVHVLVHFRRFDVFVSQDDIPVLRREAGKGHQAQRRELGVLDEPVMAAVGPGDGGEDQQRRFMASLL